MSEEFTAGSSQWILGHFASVGGHVCDVLVVEGLDSKVKVHVLRALAQPPLLMLCRQASAHQACFTLIGISFTLQISITIQHITLASLCR